MINNSKQFGLMNNIKQYHSAKICYNWEYAREEVLADNYVSIFNCHDFFIQINRSN